MMRAFFIPLFFALILCVSVARAATEPAPRLVSLAPNLTELICAMDLGHLLVGRSSACDYPSHITLHPVVGGFGRPNWEALLAVHPTVVIATDLEKPGLLKRLEEQGIQTLLLPCESWDQMKAAARAIADAAGRPEAGIKWCAGLDIRLNSIAERVRKHGKNRERPRVYVEIWNNPITTVGRDTFLNDLIESAGGYNIGAELNARYPTVSPEWVVREDPEVMVLAYMIPGASSVETLRTRIGWSQLNALRTGRVYSFTNPDELLRPGPRLVDGLEKLTLYLIDTAPDQPAKP